jgi:hypothetical protein
MNIEVKIKYIAKVMNHKSYITFHRSGSETVPAEIDKGES